MTTNPSPDAVEPCPFCEDNPFVKVTKNPYNGLSQRTMHCENCGFSLGEFRWQGRKTRHQLLISRQPAMTDAELERELKRVAFKNDRHSPELVWLSDVLEIAKKYRG